MDYAAYMRKLKNGRTTTIGFQNGQDASLNTMKRQARAQTVSIPVAVATTFSKIGGTVGNIIQATQQTSSPTEQTCSSGYKGVSAGITTADMAANRLGALQNCAVCSDAPSSEPYNIVLPCKPFLDPNSYNPNPKDRNPSSNNNTWNNPPTFKTPGNAPGILNYCEKDPAQLYRNNAEFVRQQGLQSALRTRFNLPPKLQGIRGAVYNGERH